MKRRYFTALIGFLAVATIGLFIFRDPSSSLCADDVRGYQRSTSVKVEATRTSFEALKIAVGLQEGQTIQTPLEDLTTGDFAALKAMDNQCKLLSRCVRFSFQASAANACPQEYGDYKDRVDAVLVFLSSVESLNDNISLAVSEANDVDQNEKALETISQTTSGAAGGRVAVLRARLENSRVQLENTLDQINAQVMLINAQHGTTE